MFSGVIICPNTLNLLYRKIRHFQQRNIELCTRICAQIKKHHSIKSETIGRDARDSKHDRQRRTVGPKEEHADRILDQSKRTQRRDAICKQRQNWTRSENEIKIVLSCQTDRTTTVSSNTLTKKKTKTNNTLTHYRNKTTSKDVDSPPPPPLPNRRTR
jgi:hypothetical protein